MNNIAKDTAIDVFHYRRAYNRTMYWSYYKHYVDSIDFKTHTRYGVPFNVSVNSVTLEDYVDCNSFQIVLNDISKKPLDYKELKLWR